MPAAAVAKGKKAAYHSHTEAVERRDDCSRVYQSVLGLTLETMTEGNPAFRWDNCFRSTAPLEQPSLENPIQEGDCNGI